MRFALAIVADARTTAVINFSLMVLLMLACINYARVEVVGRFGEKPVFPCARS
jgi:hypothetical protein